jgi:hypothetical protein
VKLMSLVLILLFSFSAYSQSVIVDKPEIEVQRREYEKYLFEKINQTLKTTVSEKAYVLNVSVLLRRLPAETIRVGKDAIEQPSLDVQAEYNKQENMLPLPKIGVWKSPKQQSGDSSTSYTRRVRQFTELISRINVGLYFDQNLVTEEKAQSVEGLITSMLNGATPVRSQILAQRMDLSNPVAEQVEQQKAEDLKQSIIADVDKKLKERLPASQNKAQTEKPSLMSEFKNEMALIACTLLFFMMGLMISRRYAALQEKKLRMEENRWTTEMSQNSKSDIVEINQQTVASGEVASALPQDTPGQKGGFEQFKEIVESQPERAAYLIKQWLYSGAPIAEAILSTLPRYLNLNNLNKVLSLLNEADRKQWNRANNTADHQFKFAELDHNLVHLIAAHLIEPDTKLSDSVRQLIATITPQEGVSLIKQEPGIGVLLASVLPGLQYSRILSLLDSQSIQQIAVQSESMGKEDFTYASIKLEKLLKDYRDKAEEGRTVFVEKVPELIKELGYTKEGVLFESVARSRDMQLLQDLAVDFFPAELIRTLPTATLKTILDTVPLSEKSELIYSLQSERDILLNTFAEGRLKEVIMVELDEIENDENRSRTVIRNSERYWQDFVNRLRFKVRNDQSFRDELTETIQSWARQKVRKHSQKQESSDAA